MAGLQDFLVGRRSFGRLALFVQFVGGVEIGKRILSETVDGAKKDEDCGEMADRQKNGQSCIFLVRMTPSGPGQVCEKFQTPSPMQIRQQPSPHPGPLPSRGDGAPARRVGRGEEESLAALLQSFHGEFSVVQFLQRVQGELEFGNDGRQFLAALYRRIPGQIGNLKQFAHWR